jgi:hypothetical protein
VDLNDFTKNNVCISGVNGDFGPLASYNSAAGQNRLLHAHNAKIFILSVSHISIVVMHQCDQSRGQIY